MSPYSKLVMHIDRHKYRRGQFKDEAPLDPTKRRKSENRVGKTDEYVYVQRYHTQILKAYPDGRVVLNCDGWGTHITTRLAMNEALISAGVGAGYMHSVAYKGVSQLVLGVWCYYDGMTLVPDEKGDYVPTALKSYRGRRVHKGQTQEFREGLKTSGFNDLFPILYANATIEDRPFTLDPTALHKALTDPSLADQWPGVVAYYKFGRYEYVYDPATGQHTRLWEGFDIRKTRSAITRAATEHMREMYDTNEFTL